MIEGMVYAKPPFAGPQKVLHYVGRYTHRVAISNNRLLRVEDGRVTFDWNDYRDNHRQKKMTLSAEEFITFRKEKLYRNISNKRILEQCRIVTQSGIPYTQDNYLASRNSRLG